MGLSPHVAPSPVLCRETPWAGVSFSLQVRLSGPARIFRKGRRLTWPRYFAADGVKPRGLADAKRSGVAPSSRDSSEVPHPKRGAHPTRTRVWAGISCLPLCKVEVRHFKGAERRRCERKALRTGLSRSHRDGQPQPLSGCYTRPFEGRRSWSVSYVSREMKLGNNAMCSPR